MLKEPFYTTIENQVRNDGSKGLLFDHFSNLNAALAKYYTILAAAAVSDIPYHSGYLIRDDGIMIEGRVFDRRTESEETEPTEEVGE